MERLKELQKVASSVTFQGSDTLKNVLLHVGRRSVQSPTATIKEYEIATQALGRREDFDSQADSIVRVTMNRLRQRLAEYYRTEGSEDECIIDIPKGHYRVVFHDPKVTASGRPVKDDASASEVARTGRSTLSMRYFPDAAAAVLVVILIGGWIGYGIQPPADTDAEAKTEDIVSSFWSAFARGTERPTVVYSNAPFVGNAGTTGLFYFDAATHQRSELVYTYTGVGEVMAVHALGEVFWRLGRRIEVKRGGLLGWDDAKNANLIFIGGPVENLPVNELRELREDGEFFFRSLEPSVGSYGAVVVNRQPRSGEPAVFDGSRTDPGRRDYALIRLLPGFAPDRRILLVGGVTTQGTQAAVEFLCQPNKLQMLVREADVLSDGNILPFECVLEVDLKSGVPIESRVAATRSGAGKELVVGEKAAE